MELDFTATCCEAITLEDHDAEAMQLLKRRYADKLSNEGFCSLENAQALSDLGLIHGGRITYAALILVGNEASLRAHHP